MHRIALPVVSEWCLRRAWITRCRSPCSRRDSAKDGLADTLMTVCCRRPLRLRAPASCSHVGAVMSRGVQSAACTLWAVLAQQVATMVEGAAVCSMEAAARYPTPPFPVLKISFSLAAPGPSFDVRQGSRMGRSVQPPCILRFIFAQTACRRPLADVWSAKTAIRAGELRTCFARPVCPPEEELAGVCAY